MKAAPLLTGHLYVEFKTLVIMTTLYCKKYHSVTLCPTCHDFIKHAQIKLDRCVYGQNKPACKACPIHCYKPQMRQQAKVIMQYAGPRMLLTHPILTLKHILKAKKEFPDVVPTHLSNYHQRKNIK